MANTELTVGVPIRPTELQHEDSCVEYLSDVEEKANLVQDASQCVMSILEIVLFLLEGFRQTFSLGHGE